MASIHEIPDAVRGVFAYLDATLPPEALDEFTQKDTHRGDESFHSWHAWPRKVRDIITDEFRLMYGGAPIRKALDGYRLYHKTDMANALVCAFSLHRKGRDPNEALNADYCLQWGGVLTWRTAEEVKAAGPDHWLWNRFEGFRREGDRFASYSLPTILGTLLVRGDRLVCDVVELNMTTSKVSLKGRAASDKFKELGGNRAFLAGEFDWPPAGWFNPVTDEQENEHCGNIRGILGEPLPSR